MKSWKSFGDFQLDVLPFHPLSQNPQKYQNII